MIVWIVGIIVVLIIGSMFLVSFLKERKVRTQALEYIKSLYPDEEMLELFPIPTYYYGKIYKYDLDGVYSGNWWDGRDFSKWKDVLEYDHFLFRLLVVEPKTKEQEKQRELLNRKREALTRYEQARKEALGEVTER